MDDATAGHLHRWFVVFFFIIEFGGAFFTYLTRAGMSEAQLNGLLIPYTLSLNLIILSRIWKMRSKITEMFVHEEEGQQQNLAKDFLIVAWPFIFNRMAISIMDALALYGIYGALGRSRLCQH